MNTIYSAKIAKTYAQDKIIEILKELESRTGTIISDVEFRRDMLGMELGKPVDFIKIYITLEV